MTEFEFQNPGELHDGALEVVLTRKNAADPAKKWVPSYDFDIRVGGETVGKVNFRAGTTRDIEMYGEHFAYGVHEKHRGHHYTERAVRLLLPFARRHRLQTIWITCNPENIASRRTCERLGAALIEIVPLPLDNDQYLDGEHQKCRYRIDLADRYAILSAPK